MRKERKRDQRPIKYVYAIAAVIKKTKKNMNDGKMFKKRKELNFKIKDGRLHTSMHLEKTWLQMHVIKKIQTTKSIKKKGNKDKQKQQEYKI